MDNYRLSDAHIRLGYEHGRLLPVALDEPADKSKFVTSSLGIPLRLIYKPFRNFQVSAIAYSDFGIELTSLHKSRRCSTSFRDCGHISSVWAVRFPIAVSVFSSVTV